MDLGNYVNSGSMRENKGSTFGPLDGIHYQFYETIVNHRWVAVEPWLSEALLCNYLIRDLILRWICYCLQRFRHISSIGKRKKDLQKGLDWVIYARKDGVEGKELIARALRLKGKMGSRCRNPYGKSNKGEYGEDREAIWRPRSIDHFTAIMFDSAWLNRLNFCSSFLLGIFIKEEHSWGDKGSTLLIMGSRHFLLLRQI